MRTGSGCRVDELNSVACGADRPVSQTFASALWALDTLFELARTGVRGVNFHTFPGAGYELFRVRHDNSAWRAAVAPEYYGLMMFALAAPAGSRLLSGGTQSGPVKVWATVAPDRRIRVVLINDAASHAGHVVVRASPPAGGPATSDPATLARLQAPSLTATSGVTLAGPELRHAHRDRPADRHPGGRSGATARGRLPGRSATRQRRPPDAARGGLRRRRPKWSLSSSP